MLTYPVILSIGIVGLAVASIVVFVVTGSFTAVLVVLALAGLIFYLLNLFGVLHFNFTKQGMDINFQEKEVPTPHMKMKAIIPRQQPRPIKEEEVFHIAGNNYTYEDAGAVCAAYGAELATYDQVNDAYGRGAEWCEYGWSQGGMALFPTQPSTWQTLQGNAQESERVKCGRPGVNGGYFDPKNKFGVNCYGVKPKDPGTFKFPIPVSSGNQSLVNKYKNMLSQMIVYPFNRSQWDEPTVLQTAKST